MTVVDTSNGVAEPDVGRGGEAARAGGIEALRSAVIRSARSATSVRDEIGGGAKGEYSALGGAGRQWVDRLADEGQFGIGCREPV